MKEESLTNSAHKRQSKRNDPIDFDDLTMFFRCFSPRKFGEVFQYWKFLLCVSKLASRTDLEYGDMQVGGIKCLAHSGDSERPLKSEKKVRKRTKLEEEDVQIRRS